MSFLTGIAVYFIVWWISLFLVLPWGNKPSANINPGNIESAPDNPRLLLKCIITTLLSALIWLIIWITIYFDLFNLSF